MRRSGNATVDRRQVPHEPIRSSESGVRRRSVLDEQVGAIRDLLNSYNEGLHWLITQPARCANDATRFVMTIDTCGILLRCPCCQQVAVWRAPDNKGRDARFGG